MLNTADRELLSTHREVLERVLQKLDQLPDGLRQNLSDHLWASIPETVFESGYSISDVAINAQAQTSGIRRITGAYTYLPTGQPGILHLGTGVRIPVPAGPFLLSPISVILQDSDHGRLESGLPGGQAANAGVIFVGLFGQQLPRFGMFGE